MASTSTTLQLQHPNGSTLNVTAELLARAGVDVSGGVVADITETQYARVLQLLDGAPSTTDTTIRMTIGDDGVHMTNAVGSMVIIEQNELHQLGIDKDAMSDAQRRQLADIAMTAFATDTDVSVDDATAPASVPPMTAAVAQPTVVGQPSALVGQRVYIARDGRQVSAHVRYTRGVDELKVQHEDGSFEWVRRSAVTSSPQQCGVCARPCSAPMAYIVVRVPACDECAGEKILVCSN